MGTLYICGTPIGNLEDASIRLLKTLRKVDYVVCEDTRQSSKLLHRYHIKARLISYHEHSRQEKEDRLLELLQSGHDIALLSDAGMPGISDPGAFLVRRAREAGVHLESVPGPSALTSAYSLAGIPSSEFVFTAFLERKAGKRKEYLEKMAATGLPLIIYESPHRIEATLQSLAEVYGGEHAILAARELTKLHEESRFETIDGLHAYFQQQVPRGEFCLVVPARERQFNPPTLDEAAQEVRQMIAAGWDKKEALKTKAREYGIARSDLYKCLLEKSDG